MKLEEKNNMKTIKELEANKNIPHREKVIIAMWLNQYKEEIVELINKFKGEGYTDLEIWEEMKKDIIKLIGDKE